MSSFKSNFTMLLSAGAALSLFGCGGGGSSTPARVVVTPTCNPSYQCCDGSGDCGTVVVTGSSSGTSTGSSAGSSTGSSAGSSTGSAAGSSTGSSAGSSTGSSTGSSAGSSTGSSAGSSTGTSVDAGFTAVATGGDGAKAICSTVAECAAQAQPFNQAVTDFSNIEGAGQASISDSIGGGTADVDQQQAQVAQQNQASRAQTLANSFQMDYGKALQLTQLSDQVKNMTANGQMTDEDRASVTDQALGVAQISAADVNAAAAAAIKDGDKTAVNALVDKAATNLGMPSDQELKDKLLPALGLQF